MVCIPQPTGFVNFWDIPNLLLQKFPAPEFMSTTKITFNPLNNNERVGLIVMGLDYSYISVKKSDDGLSVSQTICLDASKQGKEFESMGDKLTSNTFYLRVIVKEGADCQFSFSTDDKDYKNLGDTFKAKKGQWIGAKVGLFATRTTYKPGEVGYADVDWFRIDKIR
jgi:hypothetical protein